MFGVLFERVKNAFVDKDTGSMKIGSMLAAGAGAVAGSMLLGQILAPLGIAGPIIGAVAGAAGGLLIKETVIPMFTGGNRQQQQPQQPQGGQQQPQRTQAQGQEQEIQTPDGLPQRPTGRERQ